MKHPSRSRRAARLVVIAALAVLVGCSAPTEADVYGWRAPSHDSTTVTLVVVTGPDDAALAGQVVSESGTQVVVAATFRRASGSQTANGVFRYVDVVLKAPLGGRTVVNRNGSPVPEQRS